jgi:acyl-CoA dehydrogenase
VAEHWNFYMAYNLFRMAAILHGIAQRAVDGTAAGADAVETGAKAAPLAALGWGCALRYAAGSAAG